MSVLRGECGGAKKIVQLQSMARGLQLDCLEDHVGQADLSPYGKGTAAGWGDIGLERLQIEIRKALQRTAEAAGRESKLRVRQLTLRLSGRL